MQLFNKHKRKERQDDHDSDQRSTKHKKHNVSPKNPLSAHQMSAFLQDRHFDLFDLDH